MRYLRWRQAAAGLAVLGAVIPITVDSAVPVHATEIPSLSEPLDLDGEPDIASCILDFSMCYAVTQGVSSDALGLEPQYSTLTQLMSEPNTAVLAGSDAAAEELGVPVTRPSSNIQWVAELPYTGLLGGVNASSTSGPVSYEWFASDYIAYNICDSRSKCAYVGEVGTFARNTFNGREAFFRTRSKVVDGPAIKVTHLWTCRQGQLEGACENNYPIKSNTVYTTSDFYVPDRNFCHRDGTCYWEYQFGWYAAGYGTIFWLHPMYTSKLAVCSASMTQPCYYPS